MGEPAHNRLSDVGAQIRTTHERLLVDTATELLVFNRPPYSTTSSSVNAATIVAIRRGGEMRVL